MSYAEREIFLPKQYSFKIIFTIKTNIKMQCIVIFEEKESVSFIIRRRKKNRDID